MGRRKKEDTERLVKEQNLLIDTEYKLNDELTELFVRCEKIANKFLYDNSTQEEKDDYDYVQTNKNKIVNSVLQAFLSNKQFNLTGSYRKQPMLSFAEDDEFVKSLLTNYEPEVMKKLEIDTSKVSDIREYPDFDMSIKNEPRPKKEKYDWSKRI